MSRRKHHSDSDGDDGRQYKKRRTSDSVDIEERLEKLIIHVGDQSKSSLESNLKGLSSVLEADLPNYKGKIIKILCDCVQKYPDKVSVYTTLIGLLNAKNYSFGGEFVETLLRHLKEELKACQFEAARSSVRFLGDLVNCRVISAGSMIALFDSFIEVALEDGIPQVRSDWYVYAVMSSLPWVAHELFEKKENEFNKLIVAIRHYVEKRQKQHVPVLQVWTSPAPHKQEDYIDCLWAQLMHMQKSGWTELIIPRPYAAFESLLCEALQHTLPQVVPPAHTDNSAYPLPQVIFRMFDYTDIQDEKTVLPGSHSMARFLLEEQLSYIVLDHALERKQCAATLLSFKKDRIPLSYMIVEVCFGQLFQLPNPPVVEIMYASLFIELCKLEPSTMPIVLAQATEMLFERLDTMATPCIERFIRWLSHHLSNFQFRWSWEEWKDVLSLDPISVKPTFVRELLLKCQWLSYHQRLKDELPEYFAPLLPQKPDPQYKYGNEEAGVPGMSVAKELVDSIRAKATADDVVDILKQVPNPLSDDAGLSTHNPLAIDVFTQTLLHMGAKSFSHSFAAVAKFHSVFKTLAETEEGQMCVLKSMHELWRHHHQMMIVMTNKMLRTQIVSCSAVANWVFSEEMKQDFTCFYIWDILHGTIKKMSKHVAKLKRELDETRDRKEAYERKISDGFECDEDVPTETIEHMEERYEAAQSEQKNVFLIVFQRFIIVMGNHIAACESEGVDIMTPWYKWVSERLLQVFMQHQEQVNQYITTLETLLFTTDLDPNILRIFQQFKCLRA